MAGRYVFAPLAGAKADKEILQAAAKLAKRLDASVEAAFAEPDTAAYMAGVSVLDGMPGVAMQAINEAKDVGLDKARSAFEAVFNGADSSDARFCGAMNRSQLSGLTRLAAYTIVDSASAAGSGAFATLMEDFLFSDAAPVVVPRGGFDLDKIAVAWNGSREAANALKHALPLLRRAKNVAVIQVADDIEQRDAPASDPAQALMWLRARNVDAKLLQADGKNAAEAIAQCCAQNECGLLVIGAYGHSRARQLVFGGATRFFVNDQDGPSLLLMH